MKGDKSYPRIADVKAQPHKKLLVRFHNGVTKLYDCKRILNLPAFEPLRNNDALFRRAYAEKHGYAVIWNDELDVAESEVWLGGRVVREKPAAYGSSADRKAEGKPVAVRRKRKARSASRS